MPRSRWVEALEDRTLLATDLLVSATDLGVTPTGGNVPGNFYGKGFYSWLINTDADSDVEIDRIFGVAGKKTDVSVPGEDTDVLVAGDWDGDGYDNFGAVKLETVFPNDPQKYLRWRFDTDQTR